MSFKKGGNNPKWKGGIAEYPNHYKMKIARIEKFKLSKGLCEICKKKADVIHHIDGTKTNHELNNLIILCSACHGVVHTSCNTTKTKRYLLYKNGDWHRKSINWKKEYGIKWVDMKNNLNNNYSIPSHRIVKMHKKNKLRSFLKKHNLIPMRDVL